MGKIGEAQVGMGAGGNQKLSLEQVKFEALSGPMSQLDIQI